MFLPVELTCLFIFDIFSAIFEILRFVSLIDSIFCLPRIPGFCWATFKISSAYEFLLDLYARLDNSEELTFIPRLNLGPK